MNDRIRLFLSFFSLTESSISNTVLTYSSLEEYICVFDGRKNIYIDNLKQLKNQKFFRIRYVDGNIWYKCW